MGRLRRIATQTGPVFIATLVVLVGGPATGVAHAMDGPMKYVSQQRFVKIETSKPFVYGEYFKTSFQASDYGPFAGWIESAKGTGSGAAKQISTLYETGCQASGFTKGQFQGGGGFSGKGWSEFKITFVLERPVRFHLEGMLESIDSGYLDFSFTGRSVSISAIPDEIPIFLNETGLLQPGQYKISCASFAMGFGGPFSPSSGESSYDFTLTVDTEWCYPDCDLSGTLEIDDFVCFQTLFAMGDPDADCDGDGALQIDDFVCFQTLFALGC